MKTLPFYIILIAALTMMVAPHLGPVSWLILAGCCASLCVHLVATLWEIEL